MKKLYFILSILLLVACISINGVDKAYSWGSAAGDGTNYRQLQEVAIFFNNSGLTLSAGDVVILDTSGTAGTTLGSYVTVTNSADSVLAVGVVKSVSVVDQRPVAVVTKGPVQARCADVTDGVTSGSAVGSAIVQKQCGGGTNLGIALEGGTSVNYDEITIWVDPTGAD